MARQIGILFNGGRNTPFILGVAEGVREYGHLQQAWHFHLFSQVAVPTLKLMAQSRLDGAIVIGLLEEDAFLMRGLERLSIPAVHAGELHVPRRCHEVRTPNLVIGRFGAEHLLERGLRHFAFIGDEHHNALKRSEGFAEALAQAGCREVTIICQAQSDAAMLDALLKKLPKPGGIMTANDQIGWVVAHRAYRLGIPVPDQLALVGVGNNEPWCTLASTPLSSIVLPNRAIGLEAAAALDKLMSGQQVALHTDIPSAHVVERESSAVAHAGTPEIAAAVRYIREHFRRGISAYEVADFAGISRSTLERGIKQALGRTPLQEILRLRFAAVRELLDETDLPVKVIALRCGFAKGERLSAAFLAEMGVTPTEYRRRRRDPGRPAAAQQTPMYSVEPYEPGAANSARPVHPSA